jgi:hypothetical protein
MRSWYDRRGAVLSPLLLAALALYVFADGPRWLAAFFVTATILATFRARRVQR